MIIDAVTGDDLKYLSFPLFNSERALSILGRLSSVGMVDIELKRIVGKGHKSVVLSGSLSGGKRVAIKVLRTDTMEDRLIREAKFLKMANSISIGPRLIATDKYFIVMEMIEGERFTGWLKRETKPEIIKEVVGSALRQTWKLDSIGLDHGELSNPDDHLIVGEASVTILDFESGSVMRRPKNFTSLFQYLFVRSPRAAELGWFFGISSQEEAISIAKDYRRSHPSDPIECLNHISDTGPAPAPKGPFDLTP
ncbi:MAG: hypothetical protein JRN32_00670 [Nitrososphaerota archaeon]|jgi:putative serine/threonine protein kinase|nr:hypothetical protein [Nitrososphaerota archaeon]MDG7040038.1 hypothetical protein [Nitrososphaerota archaeon]MDG7041807.1 hypothetical protein [Nitrososphaerota archaeon]MDG7045318.1 hypothetical protein [Nitrososphaerota archaeon]MDG7046138.1 hypothetical protein [Nitrososphaerota archaeon]